MHAMLRAKCVCVCVCVCVYVCVCVCVLTIGSYYLKHSSLRTSGRAALVSRGPIVNSLMFFLS